MCTYTIITLVAPTQSPVRSLAGGEFVGTGLGKGEAGLADVGLVGWRLATMGVEKVVEGLSVEGKERGW